MIAEKRTKLRRQPFDRVDEVSAFASSEPLNIFTMELGI